MKLFFKKVLLFIVPFFLSCILLDFVISNSLKNRNSYSNGENLVWNDIYEKNLDDTNSFIYGSSRAWVHIDPAILKEQLNIPFYNLGIDGHNFYLQYLRHLELIKYHKYPDIIIYSVDEFTLAKRKDLYNYSQFLPYMLGKERIKNFLASYEGFSNFDFYFPLLRYVGEYEILYTAFFQQDSLHPVRKRGYGGIDKGWNSDLENAKKSAPSLYVEIDSTSVNLFNNFLRSAKRQQTKIIFVYTPEFYEGQKMVKNRSEILNIFKKFSEKYNIPFLDYSNHPISFDKENFYNSMHLNERGSQLFSRELAKDLKQKLLIEP